MHKNNAEKVISFDAFDSQITLFKTEIPADIPTETPLERSLMEVIAQTQINSK